MRAACMACLVFLAVTVPVPRSKFEAVRCSVPLSSHRSVIVPVQAVSQLNPCAIRDTRSGAGSVFSPITASCLCHCQANDVPY